jgi:glycosyltransferase involved in cell wall biosynthesis
MKIALITDAWRPQINGVVTTLVELVDQLRDAGHTVEVIHPGLFTTRFSPQARNHELLSGLTRPIALYVGRVSYEKNIDAFLDMPWHGSKVVCGVGPLEGELKSRYDGVRWLGVLSRDVLAGVYAAADVFTFPSRHETFGLVMLEAMACAHLLPLIRWTGPWRS